MKSLIHSLTVSLCYAFAPCLTQNEVALGSSPFGSSFTDSDMLAQQADSNLLRLTKIDLCGTTAAPLSGL